MKTKLITLAMILWALSGCEPKSFLSCIDGEVYTSREDAMFKHKIHYTKVYSMGEKKTVVPKKCEDK